MLGMGVAMATSTHNSIDTTSPEIATACRLIVMPEDAEESDAL